MSRLDQGQWGDWACVVLRINSLEQFRNYVVSGKNREEWFSLRENHDKACRFGLHQLQNCSSVLGTRPAIILLPWSRCPTPVGERDSGHDTCLGRLPDPGST